MGPRSFDEIAPLSARHLRNMISGAHQRAGGFSRVAALAEVKGGRESLAHEGEVQKRPH